MKSIRYSVVALLLAFTLLLQSCDSSDITSIPTPENVTLTNGELIWNAVEGAEEYKVYVGTKSYTTIYTRFNLEYLSLEVGEYSVYVEAIKGEIKSPASITISYTRNESVIEAILKKMDPLYREDMKASDFATTAEFDQYSKVSLFARYYQLAATEAKLADELAIPFIQNTIDIMDTPKHNLAEIFEALRDLEISGEKIAQMMLLMGVFYQKNLDLITQEMIKDYSRNVEGTTQALGIVIDYMMDYSTLLGNEKFVTMLFTPSNAIFSDEEIVGLKDTIVSTLKVSLPSKDEFTKTFRLVAMFAYILSYIAATFDEGTISESTELANEYGEAIYVTYAIGLNFLADLDLVTYRKIQFNMQSLEGTPYDVKDELGNVLYTVNETINMESAVNLILLLDNYIKTLKINHSELFTRLENLSIDYLEPQLKDYAFDIVFYSRFSQDPKSEIIGKIFSYYQTYQYTLPVYTEIGNIILQQFVHSNGKIAFDLQTIILHSGQKDLHDLVVEFDSLFEELKEYQTVAETTLTKQDLSLLIFFNVVNLPIVTLDPPLHNINQVLNDLTAEFIEIGYDYLFEGKEIIEAIQSAFHLVLEKKSGVITEIPDEVLLYAFDIYLTTENKALLEESVAMIFDALHQPFMLEELDLWHDDIDKIEASFLSDLSTFYQDLKVVVTYDFDNLTIEEKAKVDKVYEFLQFRIESEIS